MKLKLSFFPLLLGPFSSGNALANDVIHLDIGNEADHHQSSYPKVAPYLNTTLKPKDKHMWQRNHLDAKRIVMEPEFSTTQVLDDDETIDLNQNDLNQNDLNQNNLNQNTALVPDQYVDVQEPLKTNDGHGVNDVGIVDSVKLKDSQSDLHLKMNGWYDSDAYAQAVWRFSEHSFTQHSGLEREAVDQEIDLDQKEFTPFDALAIDDVPEIKRQDYAFNAAITLSPAVNNIRRSSLYAVDEPIKPIAKFITRNELDLRFAKGGLNIQGLLRQALKSNEHEKYQGKINQAYYDGQISPGWGWTLGKKVMTWGVGFGFKPLDVIQREDVRSVNAAPLLGQYVLALDRYTSSQSYSLIVSNAFVDRPDDLQRDPSIALRWYRLQGDRDLYATARFSERRQAEVGVGMTHIIDDEWSVYASGLYQVRSQRLNNTLLGTDQYFALQDPMQWVDDGSHWKAVVGAQWTGVSGLGLLFEAWYDGDAYSKKQWNALNTLTKQQKNLTQADRAQLTNANIAASSQAFLAPNLLRENALFRVSFDDRKGRKVFSDLLLTPADGGSVFSLGVEWERNRSSFKIGYRQYLSKENTTYGQAPIQSEFWGQLRITF